MRRLLHEGAAEIRILDSMEFGDPGNVSELSAALRLHTVKLGVARSADLDSILEGVDYLFHLAAEKHNQARDRPHDILRANVDGSMDLFDAAAVAGVKRIVFTSSVYAHGRLTGPPMKENEIVQPDTVYGLSKLIGEHLLKAVPRRSTMGTVSLRLFFIYGPKQFAGQGYKSVIIKNFERILAGVAPVVFGDGEQEFDFVHVDDVVEALIAGLISGRSGDIYNIGSGVGTSINTLTEHMLMVANSSLHSTHDPPDWTAASSRVSDPSKAMRVLDWRPKTALLDGVRSVYRWMRERHGNP